MIRQAKVIGSNEIVNVVKSDIDMSVETYTRYIYKEINGTREWFDHELYFKGTD